MTGRPEEELADQRAEAARTESEEALVEAQRLAQVGSWTWLVGPDVVTWSDEMFRIAGRDPQQGAPAFADQQALYSPLGWQTLQAAVAGTLATGKPYEIEIEMIRPDGEHRWIIARGAPGQDSDGRIVRLHGTVQDVTERRRAHQMLQESEQRFRLMADAVQAVNQRLERSERRYRDLVENLNDVVFSIDMNGTIDYVSRAVEKYGYTTEQLIGQPFTRLVYPEDLAGVQMSLERVKAGELQPYEFRALDHQGRVRRVRASTHAIFDGTRPVGLNGVLIDVTEQRAAEEHLRAAQRLEAVGRLAGGVAHDFNNLLVAMVGHAEIALRNLHAGDPMREDLEGIRAAGNRAAALTRQLLAFSRKQVLKPAVLDLNDIVLGMEPMLRRLIGEDIDFQTGLGDDLGTVLADPSQIEQVIMNLAVNARDAMPTGGTLRIETRNGEPSGRVILAVTDTGEGMDELTRASIFEPFFTTKAPGEGTGLGLATVYGIVKQSGGTISVATAHGHGTTFTIAFPRDLSGRPTTVRPEASEPRSGTETILVVEDEDGVRRVTTRFLSAAGYNVLTAANGGEALLMCEQYGDLIHLLLADVVLPLMSGPDLARRLNAIRPDMRVLYMSGYSGTAVADRGVLGPGMHLIPKPFSASELTACVRDVLDACNP